MNVTEIGLTGDEDETNPKPLKKASISSSMDANTLEKGDWLKYSRDTAGLGKKGNRHVNVYTQCDIKIAASHYRAVQKQCIELRLENEKLRANH